MTDAVRDALKKLYNEVEGIWSAFEFGIRAEISNTNYACVQLRLDEAEAALAATPAVIDRKMIETVIGEFAIDNRELSYLEMEPEEFSRRIMEKIKAKKDDKA